MIKSYREIRLVGLIVLVVSAALYHFRQIVFKEINIVYVGYETLPPAHFHFDVLLYEVGGEQQQLDRGYVGGWADGHWGLG